MRSPQTDSADRSLRGLAEALAHGRTTGQALVEGCLARIAEPGGEGRTTFLKVHADTARIDAAHVDGLRKLGRPLPPFAGIPVSVKDLFDIAGEVTTAGSRALADAAPAQADCPVVARLRAAGFIVIGRTNMTEFAFSGLGLNPHHGTPRNPWQRNVGRIPGGSSSGAAISVTDGMAYAGLGTDTGGSCRIPAAFTGIVGFKPTAKRVPTDGVVPLSASLDSVGPLAASVDDCAVIDAVISGAAVGPALEPPPLGRLRLAVPSALVMDGVDRDVGATFERALSRLSSAGMALERVTLAELNEIPVLNAKGGLVAAEAFAWHRRLLEEKGNLYDPRVSVRIARGAEQRAADYIALTHARADFIRRVRHRLRDFDAMVMPTVPIVAPAFAEVAGDDDYARINTLVLRNPSVANFLDGCAISLPVHAPGDAPVGLMLIGDHGADGHLLRIARSVEAAFGAARAR